MDADKSRMLKEWCFLAQHKCFRRTKLPASRQASRSHCPMAKMKFEANIVGENLGKYCMNERVIATIGTSSIPLFSAYGHCCPSPSFRQPAFLRKGGRSDRSAAERARYACGGGRSRNRNNAIWAKA
ncbi:predicted protein [Histoplasma capsulatum var. duboisii H88]|uniref:Predicted protein n=2 Tax=Ajellomyces capsulatus TaxID=5037 RepID=F0USS7_AJEC8|nr:predicted protein [Histoplasma capsulatum H143]EGC48954.1 predicted protein [Histoplasma capsulatum var. duboisii H88]